nr:hypothetical protein [uncultured Rhodopila sp.]
MDTNTREFIMEFFALTVMVERAKSCGGRRWHCRELGGSARSLQPEKRNKPADDKSPVIDRIEFYPAAKPRLVKTDADQV